MLLIREDQHGGMHTNEKLHVKLITIGSNGPYGRRKQEEEKVRFKSINIRLMKRHPKNFFAFFSRE